MKLLILLINLLLAAMIVWEVAGYFRRTPQLAVTTTRTKKHAQHPAVKKNVQLSPVKSEENAIQSIQEHNIFNITRCPDVIGGRGGSAMSLVGVYRIGNKRGAIIQQSTRRSFSRGGPWNRGNSSQRQLKPQQTFLQGETMDNGYVVSEIYDDRVVLTRGGGKLELRLELASKPITQARNAAAWRASRPNAQQIQRRMQMDNMMMMRQLIQNTNRMQQQINSGGNRGGGNTRSSRSR